MKLSVSWLVSLTLKLHLDYPNNIMNPAANAIIEIPIQT